MIKKSKCFARDASAGEFVDIVGKIFGAFKRSSSALCFVVGLAFLVMVLTTACNILPYESSVFMEKEVVDSVEVYQRPELQQYEEALEEVGQMEESERTQYYLSNLEVVGLHLAGTPTYLGFYSVIYNGHSIAVALSYWYHLGQIGEVSISTDEGLRKLTGVDALLAFTATAFVHGVFELTGFFIIAAVTLRAAWALWKALGHMLGVAGRKGGLWTREFRRHKRKIKEFLADFTLMTVIGAVLIFLAAPIEAYISPRTYAYFGQMPALAIAFLAVIAFFYLFIIVRGFRPLRKNARATYKDLKLVFKRKWRPAQLSFLVFVICFLTVLVRLFT